MENWVGGLHNVGAQWWSVARMVRRGRSVMWRCARRERVSGRWCNGVRLVKNCVDCPAEPSFVLRGRFGRAWGDGNAEVWKKENYGQ